MFPKKCDYMENSSELQCVCAVNQLAVLAKSYNVMD